MMWKHWLTVVLGAVFEVSWVVGGRIQACHDPLGMVSNRYRRLPQLLLFDSGESNSARRNGLCRVRGPRNTWNHQHWHVHLWRTD